MYKIMLADDEGIVRESLKFIVDKEFPGQFETFEAKTGRRVIELADEVRPDIAFMDIRIPGINGIDAMKLARLQWLQRASCYYWNLAAAENSEGAHNPTYYRYCLDKGTEMLDEADALLGMSSAA